MGCEGSSLTKVTDTLVPFSIGLTVLYHKKEEKKQTLETKRKLNLTENVAFDILEHNSQYEFFELFQNIEIQSFCDQ